MLLKNFVFLAAVTTRSQAYIQAMVKNNYIPSLCIIMTDNVENVSYNLKGLQNMDSTYQLFNLNESILETLQKSNINYEFIDSIDINSDIIKRKLSNLKQEYIIYSGYGGYILKEHLFEMDKKFIHIHAGILPQYRGSTTAYYSILKERMLGATAIFLSKGIDEGDIITSKEFPIPNKNCNIDYLYEPYIRSQVLIKAIDLYIKDGEFIINQQNCIDAETYFIIHPVLKHISILSL